MSTETWFDGGYACPACHHVGLDVTSYDNDGDYVHCPECERDFPIISAFVVDTVPPPKVDTVEVDLDVWGDVFA